MSFNKDNATPYYKPLSSDAAETEFFDYYNIDEGEVVPEDAFFAMVNISNPFANDPEEPFSVMVEFSNSNPTHGIDLVNRKIIFDSEILERDSALRSPHEFMRQFSPYVIYKISSMMLLDRSKRDHGFSFDQDDPAYFVARYFGSGVCLSIANRTKRIVEGTSLESINKEISTMSYYGISPRSTIEVGDEMRPLNKAAYFVYRKTPIPTSPIVIK